MRAIVREADVVWHIRLFGTLELQRGATHLSRFRTAKTGWLMAYLALVPPHRSSREVLADLLWSDLEPPRARHSLNLALSWLRNALEQPDLPAGQLLQTSRTLVGLNPAYFTTDVMQFEHALAAARSAKDAAAERRWLQQQVCLQYEQQWRQLYGDEPPEALRRLRG
ncbi:MAG: hypothetical protein RMJ83_10120, partial [Armatimonadota bacterium]|nr:hypothetical protein [Armatimonadota bacterium]